MIVWGFHYRCSQSTTPAEEAATTWNIAPCTGTGYQGHGEAHTGPNGLARVGPHVPLAEANLMATNFQQMKEIPSAQKESQHIWDIDIPSTSCPWVLIQISSPVILATTFEELLRGPPILPQGNLSYRVRTL